MSERRITVVIDADVDECGNCQYIASNDAECDIFHETLWSRGCDHKRCVECLAAEKEAKR